MADMENPKVSKTVNTDLADRRSVYFSPDTPSSSPELYFFKAKIFCLLLVASQTWRYTVKLFSVILKYNIYHINIIKNGIFLDSLICIIPPDL